MKIYVAGRVTEIDRVKHIISILEKHNHEITFDWTDFKLEKGPNIAQSDLGIEMSRDENDNRVCTLIHRPTGNHVVASGKSDLQAKSTALMDLRKQMGAGFANPEQATKLALLMRDAVREAEIVVAVPGVDALGCFVEIGIASEREMPVILIGNERDSIFWHLPTLYHVDHESQILKKLKEFE